tara:strand:- start:358 stop:1287 length:930 start_codon:yes stop_codon:yes gene_type:complete
MGIFSGVASGAEFVASKLGLTWLSGSAATQLLTGTSDIKITITVPEIFPNLTPITPVQHGGSFTLKVPDNSKILGDIALNMAQNAVTMVELAIAIQTIIDDKGGIRIKDQLDPYHYSVIKNALEENGETVPPLKEPNANILSELGGIITETGILSNLATAADALGSVSPLISAYTSLPIGGYGVGNPAKLSAGTYGFPAFPTTLPNNGVPTGILPPVGLPSGDVTITVDGYFPDYSLQYGIMSSALAIQGFVMSYAVSNFRNAIDADSKALVVKNMLGEFGKDLSDQALANADQPQPAWTEPTGQSGIR